MFDDVQDFQYIYFYVVIGAIFLIVVALVILYMSRRKVKSDRSANTMMFGDIDKMKSQGLISDEEYRQIRARAAERELARVQERDRIEREMSMVEQAKLNPDMARDLLSEEDLARASRIKKELEALRQGKSREMEQTGTHGWPDPLAAAPAPKKKETTPESKPVTPTSTPATPAPKTTVPKSPPAESGTPSPVKPPESGANQMSELDILLEKGEISLTDYMRLKKIIIKHEDDEGE